MLATIRSIRHRGGRISANLKSGVNAMRQGHNSRIAEQSTGSGDLMPEDIQQTARLLEDARTQNYQIPPLSKSMPSLNQKNGYQVAAAVRLLRESVSGSVVVGRKVGFSNRNIWEEYGIDAANWSYMYESTTIDLLKHNGDAKEVVEVDISHLSNMEPRIEPEIILGVAGAVSSSMNEEDLLGSIEWIAHGFEIVASVFPNWNFTAADTTAAFALHGLLLVGRKIPTQDLAADSEELLSRLTDFKIMLRRNDVLADEGKGSNVLGNPVKALRHLTNLLEQDEFNENLSSGEMITTGTLTRAFAIEHNDLWSTNLTGIDLPGLRVKFKLR